MTGLSFLYVALPVAMAVYLLFPPFLRAGALLGVSLLYFLLVSPLFALCMIGVAAMDLAALEIMGRAEDNPRVTKLCLAFSLVKNLGCILFGSVLFQGILRGALAGPETLLGLYVVTLSGMSCVLEAYRKRIPGAGNWVHFALYCFYFPRLAAGPLVSYRNFASKLEAPNPSLTEVAQGLGMFIQGAVKFMILGQSLQIFYGSLRVIPHGDVSVVGVWVTVLVLALSVYYRFSGCADMARGMGRMMGIPLPVNFRYPYQARSVTDFFGRFNASLTRYVGRALGSRFTESSDLKTSALGILIIGASAGLWFGVSAGRVAWGIYLGLFLIMERYLYSGLFKAVPAMVGRFYTLLVLLFGFALFDAASAAQAVQTLTRMLGFGNLPLWSELLGYLLDSNRVLLIISVFFATSATRRLLSLLRRRTSTPTAYNLLSAVINLLLLALLSAFLI